MARKEKKQRLNKDGTVDYRTIGSGRKPSTGPQTLQIGITLKRDRVDQILTDAPTGTTKDEDARRIRGIREVIYSYLEKNF